MSLNKIKELKEKRKWDQMCVEIASQVNKENINILLSLYLENLAQYHPTSVTRTSLQLSKFLDFRKGIELIDNSIASIKDCNMYSDPFEIQIVNLELQKCVYLVDLNSLDDVERKLYEVRNMQLPQNVFCLYNFLGYKYYLRIGNIEYCVDYLFKYVKMSNDETYIKDLAAYSLMSKNFFNFIEVFSLGMFSKIDETLKTIYVAVQEGNIRLIKENEKHFQTMFGGRKDVVKEKAYLIGLINLCFKETERKVTFKKIHEELYIDEDKIHGFVLKAFGLGLLKGWIDGCNNILYFNTILPRCLPNEELEKMRNKFVVWKNKVNGSIEMIKN